MEEWAGMWWEAMRKVAVSRLHDHDVAEDVVQRAFVTALSKARSNPDALNRIRNPLAWLLKITANLASGVLRTEARRHELRRKNGDEIRENLFPDPDAGSETDLRAERFLEAAPSVLTTRQFEVFRLLWEGREIEEVARKLGMKPGTVRWHRMEAIRKLREHMSRRGGKEVSRSIGAGSGNGGLVRGGTNGSARS